MNPGWEIINNSARVFDKKWLKWITHKPVCEQTVVWFRFVKCGGSWVSEASNGVAI